MSQFKKHGLPEHRGPNKERQKHLETMQRIRTEQPQRLLDYMAPMATIPPLDWAVLKKRFPELNSKDAQIKKQAWDRFMADPVSDPYRVKERIWRPLTAI